MTSIRTFPASLISVALCLFGAAAKAQTSPLSGSVSLGTRSVDVEGTTSKYREDVNLEDGVRLFDVALSYRPTDDDSPVDDVSLTAYQLGGDPFESINLTARKFGAWQLKLDRRRSDYFYEDTILPLALASVNGSTGGDFHHFDFERVRDSASLEIALSPATSLSFGLDRQTRIGESTTSLDIQRDEFEFDKPLDETLQSLRFGIEHDFERVTLIFEEEIREFENISELFLPGASPGQNTTTNPAELQFLFLDQAYDYDSNSHLLRAVARPSDRIDLSAMWRYENLDLDTFASEASAGTDFTGAPFTTDLQGTGRIGRDVESFGLDFGFAIGERARLIASHRSNTLEQDGGLNLGGEQGTGTWNIETDAFELGAEIVLAARTVVTAGWSAERRDAGLYRLVGGASTFEQTKTERDGFFARLRHRTENGLQVTASIEDNSIDDPYALAAPSDSERYRVALDYTFDNGIGIQGSHQRTDVANDASGWLADTDQTNIRLRYTKPRTMLSVGLSRIDIAREISQLVTGGTLQVLFPIAYAADAQLRDISVRRVLTDRLTMGGSIRTYENRGSYALDRDDNRVFAEIGLSDAWELLVSYRQVDYTEDAWDAYDAEILELRLRLSW